MRLVSLLLVTSSLLLVGFRGIRFEASDVS